MSSGPCLCGDPYCARCGSPEAARLEAAEEWLTETCRKADLSPEEYRVVGSVGLAAVHHCRRAVAELFASDQNGEDDEG